MDVAKSKHLMFVYKFDAHMNNFLLVVNSEFKQTNKAISTQLPGRLDSG